MCCPRVRNSVPDVCPLIRRLCVPQDALSGLISVVIISAAVHVVLSIAFQPTISAHARMTAIQLSQMSITVSSSIDAENSLNRELCQVC